ncbi:SCP domain-containing protein [Haematococcus lacustris]|uniref:SCP domain-containing protein n=1 Tax=Haematococcus lacustris TaxID=44745 RepID=A0A699YMK0_HAELA|nr:SCP domain-containing protein [Haematococcus lacustris]
MEAFDSLPRLLMQHCKNVHIQALLYYRYNEQALYSYTLARYSRSTGHFTQMVWKDTTQVGCASAVSRCNARTVLPTWQLAGSRQFQGQRPTPGALNRWPCMGGVHGNLDGTCHERIQAHAMIVVSWIPRTFTSHIAFLNSTRGHTKDLAHNVPHALSGSGGVVN